MEGCDTIEGYAKMNKIHEGVYGEVFRARDLLNGEVVAIKKIKYHQAQEKEGFPITSIREFNILLSLCHPNIVKVKRVVVGAALDKVYMVMEYMEHELKDLIENQSIKFTLAEVKSLVKQLLLAIEYFHSRNIMHRDLKTSNLLYNNKGQLKVCDFGLGRKLVSSNRPQTQKVVTLWYRAPELLLGDNHYTTQIDVWSAGCIFAELVLRDQLFRGQKELEHLDAVFRVLGTPTDESWPGWKTLPVAAQVQFPKYAGVRLADVLPKNISEAGLDLLRQMLTLDPNKRITATRALKHEWFRELPMPQPEELMPTFPALNEVAREERKKVKVF